MKIIPAMRAYQEDPTRYFEFNRFKDQGDNYVLIEGLIDFSVLEKYKDEKIVYLEFDEPNIYFLSDPSFNHIPYNIYFNKVLSLCPYTSEWANKYTDTKHEFAFFPFNERFIPKGNNKVYDVIYTGHILSKDIKNIINVITKYNYRIVSASLESKIDALKRIIFKFDYSNIGRRKDKYITDFNISYFEKIDLISKSKIMVVNNLLFPTNEHIQNVVNIDNWDRNEAYSDIKENWNKNNGSNKQIYVPQIKSRVFEAAFSKTLILCRRDKWNVIEKYFVPDEEFIYYEEEKLRECINTILNNWDYFQDIAQKAFERAIQNYTTKIYFNKYLKTL